MRLVCLAVLVFGGSYPGWAQAVKTEARVFLKQGDDAMMQRKWHDAEVAFQQAADADPASVEAHSKLSNALALELRPGPVTAPENRPLLARVLAEQQRAAELAPGDPKVLSQLARIQDAIGRSSQDPDEQTRSCNLAVQTFLRAIQLAPDDANLHFQLATTQLSAAVRVIGTARRNGHDPVPGERIRDNGLRQGLALQFNATLSDAITHLEKVVQLQADNGFAMLLASLGYFIRADLANSDADAAHDKQAAMLWEQRFRRQWSRNYKPDTESNLIAVLLGPRVAIANDPNISGVLGGILGGVAGGIPGAAPPPPQALSCSTFSADKPVRFGGNILAGNLLKQASPVYPATAKAARVQGTVKFEASIDKTGHVRELQLISGHPLLVAAAREAVIQWEYRPMVLCGKPVEVITEVTVSFTLSP